MVRHDPLEYAQAEDRMQKRIERAETVGEMLAYLFIGLLALLFIGSVAAMLRNLGVL